MIYIKFILIHGRILITTLGVQLSVSFTTSIASTALLNRSRYRYLGPNLRPVRINKLIGLVAGPTKLAPEIAAPAHLIA